MIPTCLGTQFQINDSKLANSDMMTYKSWADECDEATTTPPKHGAQKVVK